MLVHAERDDRVRVVLRDNPDPRVADLMQVSDLSSAGVYGRYGTTTTIWQV